MRYSMVSLAALGLASIALGAPFNPVERRDPKHGRGRGQVVTEVVTVTVTEIVYAPDDPPVTTTLESRPETTPEPQPEVPTPTPEPEEPKPDVPKPEEPKPYIDPTPTPEPTPTPTPTPAPEDNTPPENNTPPEDSAPPPSDSPSNLDDFAAMALKSHNDRRALHGVGPLEYDATMADYANNHVQSCIFEHSSPRVYGENLAAGYANIEAAIKGWYDEIKDYPFDKPDFYPGTGHFTQVIWKAATKMGCGFKACDGANGTPGVYYSCNYDEGNLIGAFKENVLPPK